VPSNQRCYIICDCLFCITIKTIWNKFYSKKVWQNWQPNNCNLLAESRYSFAECLKGVNSLKFCPAKLSCCTVWQIWKVTFVLFLITLHILVIAMLITNRHVNPTKPAFFDSPAYTNTPVKVVRPKPYWPYWLRRPCIYKPTKLQ